MRRFVVVFKKELREMLTWQMLIPILLVMIIYGFLGRVINQEQQKQSAPQPIAVLDLDHSGTSAMLTGILAKADFVVTPVYQGPPEQVVAKAVEDRSAVAVMVIPEGFESGILARKPQTVQTYTIIRSFSMSGIQGTFKMDAALSAMNESIGDAYLRADDSGLDPAMVRNAVSSQSFVTVGTVSAEVSPQAVVSVVTQQTLLIPIVLFMVIMMSAQMIAASIAGEKENKTLETLLSTPVGRGALVTAKMTASGLVALVTAAAYMVGMRNYMSSLVGTDGNVSASVSAAVRKLGLVLDARGYALLGLSVFAAIMVALALAVILGAASDDIKSAQVVITPLMMLILLPYLLSMFVDLSTTSPVLRWLIYAIPFSHPFLAPQLIFARNFHAVVLGIVYESVVFGVLAVVAARIFSSDRILTMKLGSAGRRRTGLNSGRITLPPRWR